MKLSIRNICYIALMAALTGALSILTIPTPWGVPFTLQTFAISLCGYLLGRRDGTISVILYVLLGAIGLPVYAGMKGGVGVLAGPTGGYIIGFLFLGLLCGVGVCLTKSKAAHVIAPVFGILGLFACHVCGCFWFAKLTERTFWEAALVASVPYLVKDILSVIFAYAASLVLKKALVAAHLFER